MKSVIFSFTRLLLVLFTVSISFSSYAQMQSKIQTPADFFGFQPGADRMLFDYEEQINYLEHLANYSPRLQMKTIGESPMGKPMYAAFFSNADNIKNLDSLRKINEELALNPNLNEEQKKAYIQNGKVFFIATLSMHANEVGPAQAAPQIAYKLVTTENQDTLTWLEDVVYMMIPSHNPDGMDMVVEHYKKYKGTKYEGSSMPGVYHKYVGHDNNRDFVTLTQEDNRAISDIFSKTWFPQVMVEKHQMGSTGPRYFVPPNHDPIAENIDASIWNWMGVFGMNMIKDMTNEGLAGVSQHYAFDNYWPGSTETCIWKNVIGFLTEAASAKFASPVYVEPNELSVWGKGLSEYKKSINMPLPWDGGWWRLSDIVDYEIVSTMSVIKTCSKHKEDILSVRNDLAKSEVKKGKTEAPYYYIFPGKQHDESELVDLVNLLDQHGVKRYKLTDNVEIESKQFKKGDIVIPLAQPFRPFIKEVLESQDYPVRHYTPGGEIIKPYDITSWSLPLHKGVESFEIDTRSEKLESSLEKISGSFDLQKNQGKQDFNAMFFPYSHNESYKIAFWARKNGLDVFYTDREVEVGTESHASGGFIIPDPEDEDILKRLKSKISTKANYLEDYNNLHRKKLQVPKIAMVETYLHDMDAGWTRYLFDEYFIPFEVIRPGDIPEEKLSDYDVVIFPNTDKSVLLKGEYETDEYYRMSDYPPQYVEGMGESGKKKIMGYFDKGGKIISWGKSTELFMKKQEIKDEEDEEEQFKFPIDNISDKLKKKGLYCPGTLVNVDVKENMNFTKGLQEQIGVFYRGAPVFKTSIPIFDMNRRVLGSFSEENIVLSGYAEEAELLEEEPAMAWISKGAGEMVLFSFNPQFRAAVPSNYKLIFNSLLFDRKKKKED